MYSRDISIKDIANKFSCSYIIKRKNMASIKVKATFKGKHGKLGYKYGIDYILLITIEGTMTRVSSVEIKGTYDCLYENTVKFLEDWSNIKVI
jgi:hypothetical protein